MTSFGTGVFISGNAVITAKHVICSGKKLRAGSIYVQPVEGQWHEYQCVSDPALAINTGTPESHPFPVDLAILVPSNQARVTTKYLPLSPTPAPIGTEVILAGFSDDTYMPLDFEESFDTRSVEGMDKEKEFTTREPMLRQLLCKKGMIGSRWNVTVNNYAPREPHLKTATYALDTDISYGASGGPVVDLDGNLIGIVCKKGVADATRFRIATSTGDLRKLPSGTSYALDHSLVTCFLPKEFDQIIGEDAASGK